MAPRTLLVTALLAFVALFPSAAAADTIDPDGATAKTNKGGFCRLDALLARAGGAITYGGRVSKCSARFGIRQVTGRALLYEGINTAVTVGDSSRVRGNVPFEISQGYTGEASEFYEARFDVTVVIYGGKSKTKPKHPEKWSKAGRGCRIMTTNRSGDTLGCVFGLESQPVG